MLTIHLENSGNGDVFEISTLVNSLKINTFANGQPSKLTFNLLEDPNKNFSTTNGSIIRVTENKAGIFYGFVFTVIYEAKSKSYKITAYNQMRYLKNDDTKVVKGVSASQLFGIICKQYNIKHKIITPTNWVIAEKYYNKNSLHSIINDGIQETNIATGKHYFIRDNFGCLEFTELHQNKTDIIIGDGSLLCDYTYERSIDKDTFNTIKVVRSNRQNGKRETRIQYDNGTRRKWGILQKLVEVDEAATEAQIIRISNDLLNLKNRETETMKITALRFPGLVAGSGFMLSINKLGLEQYVWIASATHSIERDFQSMELDIFIQD
jgi:hypothetical protein